MKLCICLLFVYRKLLTALSRFGVTTRYVRNGKNCTSHKCDVFFVCRKKYRGLNLYPIKEKVFRQVTVVRAAKVISEEWRLDSTRHHQTVSNPIFPIIGKSNSLDPWSQQICKPIWRASKLVWSWNEPLFLRTSKDQILYNQSCTMIHISQHP